MLANQIKALHNPIKEDKHCFSLEEEMPSVLNEVGLKFTSGIKAALFLVHYLNVSKFVTLIMLVQKIRFSLSPCQLVSLTQEGIQNAMIFRARAPMV